jgi:hypothetical protein
MTALSRIEENELTVSGGNVEQMTVQVNPPFGPNDTWLDTNPWVCESGLQGSIIRGEAGQQQPTFQQLQARLISLRKWIETEEASLAQLNASRHTMSETVFLERANRQRNEIRAKKQMFQKACSVVNARRLAYDSRRSMSTS